MLHVISGLDVGGAERSLFNLIFSLPPDRFEHIVFSLHGDGFYAKRIGALGVQVYVFNFSRLSKFLLEFRRLSKAFLAVKPDLIQGWMNHGILMAAVVKILNRNQIDPLLIWNIRQSLDAITSLKFSTKMIIWLNKFLSGYSNAIIYNSRLSRYQHERKRYVRNQGHVLPNGFDVTLFSPDKEVRKKVRERFEIDQDAFLIGHVARFHPMKDHQTFVEAAGLVLQEFPKTYFMMIGRDVEKNWPKISKELPKKLLDRFLIVPECQDLVSLYRAMDGLCLSSTSESFPNVVGEAMACGVPCVSTEVGDVAKIIDKAGFIVPVSDIQKLANAMKQLISMPPTSRKSMSRQAREQIVSKYSLDEMAKAHLKLYDSLIGSSTKSQA